MRKINGNYSVHYKLTRKDGEIQNFLKGTTCYSGLFGIKDFNEEDVLNLTTFLAEGTSDYAKVYIEKLCFIFDVKFKHEKEDSIIVTGFKNLFYLKSFLTLFRILFENYTNKPQKNINFLKSFIENEYKIKDVLKRLLYCHKEKELDLGEGHGITQSHKGINTELTKKVLKSYIPNDYCSVNEFFTIKKK